MSIVFYSYSSFISILNIHIHNMFITLRESNVAGDNHMWIQICSECPNLHFQEMFHWVSWPKGISSLIEAGISSNLSTWQNVHLFSTRLDLFILGSKWGVLLDFNIWGKGLWRNQTGFDLVKVVGLQSIEHTKDIPHVSKTYPKFVAMSKLSKETTFPF